MKVTEIVGYNRANLGRPAAQELRAQGMVPAVLYGGSEQVSFYAPAYLFNPLIFTPDAYEVKLNIEGKIYSAILQDKQFHPVNETLVHADFLEITPDKVIKISIPIILQGTAIGQKQGGKLVQKLRKLYVQGPAKDIPEFVNLDISQLKLAGVIKVESIVLPGLTILDSPANPVASIIVPRLMRVDDGGSVEEETDEETTTEGASENAEGQAEGETQE